LVKPAIGLPKLQQANPCCHQADRRWGTRTNLPLVQSANPTKGARMSTARIQQTYLSTLTTELSGRNVMALPRLKKITVSIGTGKIDDKKQLEFAKEALRTITGQQPVETRAHKAIAGFKLRAGDVVGLQVTLRNQRMWDFLERLISIALPRIRDFHGLKLTGFDKQGNYSFGIREHTVFPEIEEERANLLFGLGIVLTTSATNEADGQALMAALHLPLEHKEA